MDLKRLFRSVELFEGLTQEEIDQILKLCDEKVYKKGDLLTVEGEVGEDLQIIIKGDVEVILENKYQSQKVVVTLGAGQLIGEMSLVDRGLRSASVRAIQDPTIVQIIRSYDFRKLCEQNNHIGYLVMLNLAADLSFKLRHRHLNESKGN